jgi:hypothetical protein
MVRFKITIRCRNSLHELTQANAIGVSERALIVCHLAVILHGWVTHMEPKCLSGLPLCSEGFFIDDLSRLLERNANRWVFVWWGLLHPEVLLCFFLRVNTHFKALSPIEWFLCDA